MQVIPTGGQDVCACVRVCVCVCVCVCTGMAVTSAGVAAVPGIIASISEEGYLCLSYMGTDPPSQVVNTTKAALNYDNMDEEHRRLLTVIREATADKRSEPTGILLPI